MVFVAGQKVRASQLNTGVTTLLGYSTADTSVASSTTLVNATGVAISVEANATYMWDAYLAYNANEAADLKFAWAVPSGATGHWSEMGVDASEDISTLGRGKVTAARFDAYGDATTGSSSGRDSTLIMACWPRGYLVTAGAAGTFQLRFAQLASNATGTVIKAGSWVRAVRLA